MKTLLSLLLLLFLSSCDMPDNSSSDDRQADQTEELMRESNRQVGMPNIVNFQERKLAKMILELRDQEDFLTYTYIINMHGEMIYLGRSMGYGLPYAVQFTNPVKTVGRRVNYGYEQLPQADPNGLFMPDALSATWVLLIDPETDEARPVYVEPEIIVSPIRLH